MKTHDKQREIEDKRKLLEAFTEEETRYTIDVRDNSMLPDNMKDKKALDFVIKPPSLYTISRAAKPLLDIPQELMKPDAKPTLQQLSPYTEQMVESFCLLSWTKKSELPEWYVEFMMQNCTPKEIFYLFTEGAMKMRTDFFLTSFQIASQNPMKLEERKKENQENQDTSTPIN